MFWEVDLRPHASAMMQLGEAQIRRTRLRIEGLEGFEFTLDQRDGYRALATIDSGHVN
jgi:hypothetical protein